MNITGVVKLPLNFQLPWYDFTCTLDGTRYTFTIRYNARMDRWFMDIADAQGNPLVSGIVLLVNRFLTQQYSTVAIPSGLFFVLDNTGNNNEPTLQSFLTTHALYYASVA